MALELTAFNIGTQTFSICANMNNIVWENLKPSYDDYVANLNRPLVEYSTSSLECSAEVFQWLTTATCNSSIDLSAIISDTGVIRLCAYDPADPTGTSAIIELYPSYAYIQLDRINNTSVSATSYYQQVSTLLLSTIPSEYMLTWEVSPSSDTLSAFYGSSVYLFSNPILTDSVTVVSSIVLSSDEIDYNTYSITLSVFGHPFSYNQYASSMYLAQDSFVINGSIELESIASQTDRILLSASQYNIALPQSTLLSWNITPSAAITLSAIKADTTITINTETSALCADYVAFITTNFTNEYTYILSSGNETVSGIFRPYIDLTNSLSLTTTIDVIDDTQQDHQYYLQVHGLSAGVAYNLNSLDYLIWLNTTNDSGLVARNTDNTTYNFDLSTISPVAEIDNLYLDIYPSITTIYPRLCTYSFMVCALSGSSDSDSMITTNFTITATEWLDSSIFTPDFTVQYEPIDQTIFYRSLTTANYLISNHSILPLNSKGNFIYTFDDVVSTIPYDLTTGNVVTGIYHIFDGSVQTLCTINLTIYASAAGYSDYVVRTIDPKYIQFTSFPIASTFIVYPEFTWDTDNWYQVVFSKETNEGDILRPNTILSAYSYSHTENFFVSCNTSNGTSYKWEVGNSLLNYRSVTFTSNTGWIAIDSPNGTDTYPLSVAIYNAILPTTMPSKYYDTPTGQMYPNFSTTFETPTSIHRKHINYYTMDVLDLIPSISAVPNSVGVPSDIYLTGGYSFINGVNNSPFDFTLGLLTFSVSTNYVSSVEINAGLQNSTQASNSVSINVDDIGNSPLSVPKYDINNVQILISDAKITPTLKIVHPSANNWGFTSQTVASSVFGGTITIPVYPVLPLVYTPNRYVVTGVDVSFENLANCFSGIQDFVWTDRGNEKTVLTCSSYVTSYNSTGPQDITLVTHFSGYNEIIELENSFNNLVNIEPYYETFNPDITRIYGTTVITLSNDETICKMGTNDFVVADTFNSCMQKLHENLIHLKNMSKLYDNPPTEYYGWLGSIYYANSSKHFRWFVNSPYISYAYDEPTLALDDRFTNLTDIYVKNNIMYISNTTSVSVLSSDFRATLIGYQDYKTIGDNFTNVKAVQVDSLNRVYILDGNRIAVFNFDNGIWTLLYGWGGLGGPSAKSKFNNPNDFYIDKNNNIWVADTDNKVVKKYTRTGSWLQTITSSVFDNNPPMSVVLDENDYIHILTNSTVVKFDTTGVFIEERVLTYEGAKTIRECRDQGFGYICYADKVIKYMYLLDNQAIFANNDFTNYTEDYRNVFHDEYRNLYIVAKNHILKYIDKLSLVSIIQDTEGQTWPLEHLFVDKNEYCQDWVLNRCFNRMYDNIEIFRKSILGKFDYKSIQTSVSSTVLSTIDMPTSGVNWCETDWLYNNGKLVEIVTVTTFDKPTVRSFTVEEYKQLPYTKDDMYIGLNEFVAAPVINRPINKLLACQDVLREMLS